MMKGLIRDERGQAMLITLVLLLIGSIIITPVLNFIGTGITSGRIYEQKIDEIYAADAGVEDALWHIRYDQVEDLLGGGYDEYNYNPPPYDYPYDLSVNGKNVTVTIQNVWIPKDLAVPSSSVASQIIKDEKLIIIGYPGTEESTYVIKIVYYWESGEDDDLLVETIGIWLSPGFEYIDESCDLAYDTETISLYKGGYAVVWEFSADPLIDFPVGEDGPPMVKTFTFEYTGPEGLLPELVSSWIDTTGVPNTNPSYSYTWDDSIRLYKIMSEAGGVQIEAYGAKTKFRKLKSTISSDYAIAGNSLMKATDEAKYRDRLYAERDSTIQRIGIESIPESKIVPPGKIPEESIIEDVYLYWTGWIDYHYRDGDNEEEIEALKYPDDPDEDNLKDLVEDYAKVNIAKFDVDTGTLNITADKWQTVNTYDCDGAEDSWAYSCFTDVTDLVVSGEMTVREYIEEEMKSDGSGTVTFTLGHADEVRDVKRPDPGADEYYFDLYIDGSGDPSTGYPLATPAHKYVWFCIGSWCWEHYPTRYQYTHSSWSLIIFYRSPALKQRQLYLFDDLHYASSNIGPSPHEVEFTISGFLVPPVLSAEDKSHASYMVGEGDPHYDDSYMAIRRGEDDYYFSDPPDNPENNVFNSWSTAIPDQDTDGADIDTFEVPEGAILSYETSAKVVLTTTKEIYVLIYIVLSFRSDLTTGGIITNYSVSVT